MAILKVQKSDTDSFQVLAIVRGGRRWLHTTVLPSWDRSKALRDRMLPDLTAAQADRFEDNENWAEQGHKAKRAKRAKPAERKAEARKAAKPESQKGEAYRSEKPATASLASLADDWLGGDRVKPGEGDDLQAEYEEAGERELALGDYPAVPSEAEVEREAEQARFEAEQDMALQEPPPGTWAATARFMAQGDDSGFDWDAWKDEQTERDLN